MELKEYYKIWRENVSVAIFVTLIVIIIVYAWSVKKSETYSTALLLGVSRTETQSTAEYKYDQFYRLQADEKFSETIVSWLKSPGVAKDIFKKAGAVADQKTMRQLSKSFHAEKASSEIVSVSFGAQNEEEAKKIANAVFSIVSEKTKSMNSEARDLNWFSVDMTDLIIAKNIQDLRINLIIAALLGIFIGTLLAFGKHYISEEK